MSERSDNDPSNKPKPTIRDRIRNFDNLFSSRSANSGGEPQISVGEAAMQMSDLRRRHSSANLRGQMETPSQSQRLQAQLDRALAAFQPIPPGMSGSPPPPDYGNQPMVGSPLDSTGAKPSAPVNLGEATRNGVDISAVPGRVITAAGPMSTAMRVYRNPNRNPNRLTFTPIPSPQPEEPPNVPIRDNVGAPRTSRDDPPPLPSR